jgi:hypothetical protein
MMHHYAHRVLSAGTARGEARSGDRDDGAMNEMHTLFAFY